MSLAATQVSMDERAWAMRVAGSCPGSPCRPCPSQWWQCPCQWWRCPIRCPSQWWQCPIGRSGRWQCPAHRLRASRLFAGTLDKFLFARSIAVHCRVFLAASPVAVQAYYERLALGRGVWFASGEVTALPEQTAAREDDDDDECHDRSRAHAMGPPWAVPISLTDVLPPCARANVDAGWALVLEARYHGKEPPNMVCVMQSPLHIKPGVPRLVPTLCTGTRLYSFEADRLVIPEEALLMQGFPVPTFGDIGPAGNFYPFRLPLGNLFSDRTILRFAGNGMHISQIGAALLLVLSSAKDHL